jgi:hypothetical protein
MESSTWNIHQVAENTFDLIGKISGDEETTVDEMGIQQDRLEFVLMTALENEKPVNEITSLGDDPLGAKARKQDRKLNESSSVESGSIQESAPAYGLNGAESFAHLKEVLPLADNESFVDDAGNFIIAVDALRVRIIPKGANLFDVESFVSEKRMPKQTQLTYEETVKGVFDLVAAVEGVKQTQAANVTDDDEFETGDVYEVLRELAGELGHPTDNFRNRSLFDLRAGLVIESKKPNIKNDLLSGLDQHLEKFSTLKSDTCERIKSDATTKARWFRGHPVAVAGEMHGKTLAYVQNVGAVLVDKKDMPPSKSLKLSWDDKRGAVLVPITEQVKRPSWKHFR